MINTYIGNNKESYKTPAEFIISDNISFSFDKKVLRTSQKNHGNFRHLPCPHMGISQDILRKNTCVAHTSYANYPI